MRHRAKLLGAAIVLGLVAAVTPVAQTAAAPVAPAAATSTGASTAVTLAAKVTVKKYKNCTALNKVYKHGVGKTSARDKVRGRTKPVTNFKRHNALYQKNKQHDRDRDGVACEKR